MVQNALQASVPRHTGTVCSSENLSDNWSTLVPVVVKASSNGALNLLQFFTGLYLGRCHQGTTWLWVPCCSASWYSTVMGKCAFPPFYFDALLGTRDEEKLVVGWRVDRQTQPVRAPSIHHPSRSGRRNIVAIFSARKLRPFPQINIPVMVTWRRWWSD